VTRPIKGEEIPYYCRGCGGPLPPGFRGLFHHPDCLKADKRRRTSKKRRLERERFEVWLSRQRCPECGVRLGPGPQDDPHPSVETLCEASQGPQRHEKAKGQGADSPQSFEAIPRQKLRQIGRA